MKIKDIIADLHVNDDNVSIGNDDDYQRIVRGTDNISIFTVGRPPSLDVVLSMLPPREEVDRYLSKYFNVKFVVLRTYDSCSILYVLTLLIYESYYTRL